MIMRLKCKGGCGVASVDRVQPKTIQKQEVGEEEEEGRR